MSNRIDRVVITGASSGIGFDMARRFLAEGSQLLINARNPEKLEAARRRLEGGRRVVASMESHEALHPLRHRDPGNLDAHRRRGHRILLWLRRERSLPALVRKELQ